MTPAIAELTLPALFAAGASTSLHCALMCGAINAAQLRSRGVAPLPEALALVHAGRVSGYALLGALAGAAGARLAFLLPDPAVGSVLQALAAATLVVAGIRHWRGEKRVGTISAASVRPCHGGRPEIVPTLFPLLPPRARLFAQGLLWAAMPCGILYAVVLLAAFSASAGAGFLLLAAFGLGTVPLMGASGGLLALAARPRRARGLRVAAGAALVMLGVSGGVLAALSPGTLGQLLCAVAPGLAAGV